MPDSRAALARTPRLPSWAIERARLVDQLEAGLLDGLAIVRGPGGTGKTLLLTQWSHAAGREGTWVTVDDSIATRSAFWEHVLAAPGLARAQSADTVEALTDSNLHAYLHNTFDDRGLTLVLDDYHNVREQAVHDDVAWLVQHTQTTVVLATRTITPFETGPLATRIGAAVIAADDLNFTLDETRQLLTSRVDFAEEFVTAAFAKLGGWPLATRAAELELVREGEHATPQRALDAVTHLLSEDSRSVPLILLDSAGLRFALATSIAESFTVELATILAPEVDVEATLARLESEGLGGWGTSAQGDVFRYQPFVRHALEARLSTLGAAEVLRLRRAYARWADDTDRPLLAAQQAAAAGDWQLLARITQRHLKRVLRVHSEGWKDLLSSMPLDALRRNPVLTVVLLLVLNSESAPTARLRGLASLAMNSLAPLRERGSRADRLWRNAAVLGAERVTGRYTAAAATAERLAELIASLDAAEYAQVEEFLSLILVHIATSRLYDGDSARADSAFAEAVRAAETAPWSLLHAMSMRALVPALGGRVPEAMERATATEQAINFPGWRGTYSASGYHLAHAISHIEDGDVPAARAQVALLDRHFETIEHWPIILTVRGWAAIADGSAQSVAQQFPEDVRMRSRRSPTSKTMRAMLTSVHADLLTAAGRPAAAERLLTHGAERRPHVMLLGAHARAAAASGEYARALMLAQRVIKSEALSVRDLAAALIVVGIAEAEQGHPGPAAKAIDTALDLVTAHGLRMPLLLSPREPLVAALEQSDSRHARRALELLRAAPVAFAIAEPDIRLTPREHAVLVELARTPSTAEIADALFVSPNTVKSQLRSLYGKLSVSTRDDAIAAAIAAGLLGRE